MARIRTMDELVNVLERKECTHDGEIYKRTFMKNEIERQGMYCKECGYLLDYIPQYNED